jgi:hypothetical protein
VTRQVHLPPGCSSLQMEDGTRYKASRPGGTVTVSDSHGNAINRMGGNGTAGLVNGNPGLYVVAKKGRECPSCHRRWHVWTTECPKCSVATEPL